MGQMHVENGANSQNSTVDMGITSAIIRNAAALPDSDPRKYIAMAQGIKAYDEATVELKTGNAVDLSQYEEARSVLLGGRAYDRLLKDFSNYSGSGQLPANFSIFRAHTIAADDRAAMLAASAMQSDANIHGIDTSSMDLARSMISTAYGTDENNPLRRAALWYADKFIGQAQGTHFYTE